jgi:small subunit ribosomal protein S29
MASTYCWSCLARVRPTISTLPSPRVVISTPPVRRKSVTSAKTTPKTPKFRESKNVRIKKWNKGKEKAVKVTPELKAQRKRIILSNTNALTVPIEDLSLTNMADGQSRGQILGIPVTLIDQLRALDAFKITQKWGVFRKPATIMRKQTVEIGRLIDRQARERKTVRRFLTGDRGTGKSVVLLQAMAMALLKGWIVISVPDGQTCFFSCLIRKLMSSQPEISPLLLPPTPLCPTQTRPNTCRNTTLPNFFPRCSVSTDQSYPASPSPFHHH